MKEKLKRFIPAAVFLLFTFSLCLLFFVMPKKDYSTHEKRYLAETPQLSVQSLLSGELVKAVDGDSDKGSMGYVADHFPFRSFFVGLNSYYNLSFGNTADSDYYFGKDGYIITKPCDTSRIDTNIRVVNNFAENIDVTLCVVPSAGYILEDKLPLNHTEYPDSVVYKKLEDTLSENVQLVNLSTDFKELYNSSSVPIYYKTDHHWTTPAAFYAYEKLSDVLGFDSVDEGEFTKKSYGGFYGTTYSSSGYFLSEPDILEVWENESTNSIVSIEITEGSVSETYTGMYFESHLEEDDMYPVFLDGNHALVRIQNSNAEDRKLLIIKDSYAHALAPFMAENYSEIVMVDMRYYKENITELCEGEGITDALVIYSMSNFCTDTSLAFLE